MADKSSAVAHQPPAGIHESTAVDNQRAARSNSNSPIHQPAAIYKSPAAKSAAAAAANPAGTATAARATDTAVATRSGAVRSAKMKMQPVDVKYT